MAQCPNCHAEVKPDERFCGNCGTRLEQPLPHAETAAAQPDRPQPTGKETIVLPAISDTGLNRPPPAPAGPPADATIISPPAAPVRSPVDATIVSAPAAQVQPPTTPVPTPPIGGGYSGAGSTPPVALPQAQPIGGYPGGAAPPPPAVAQQAGGGNVWKVLAVIALLAVLACVALGAAAYYFVVRPATNSAQNLIATANAGLSSPEFATVSAGLATAVAEPTAARPTAALAAGAGGSSGSPLQDNFDDPNQSTFRASEDDSSKYAFVDGAYVITVKKPSLISWASTDDSYGNVSIAVDARIDGPKTSAAGLIFRYQDDKNFYIYRVSGDGRYKLDMYKDDNLIPLVDWVESPAIKGPGAVNRLRVEAAGDKIRLFANDQLLDETSDGTFARGQAAIVAVTTDEPNVTVTFDNLVIEGIK